MAASGDVFDLDMSDDHTGLKVGGSVDSQGARSIIEAIFMASPSTVVDWKSMAHNTLTASMITGSAEGVLPACAG